MKRFTEYICQGVVLLLILFVARPAFAGEIPWTVTELIPGGRIDAIAYAGHHVVIAGTRDPNPGWIFYSTDDGRTWQKGQRLGSTEKRTGVTCIACGKNGLCFAINESSEFYRSTDYGKTWTRIGKVSHGASTGGKALSYGLCVTKEGTLLISDTNDDGGYVFRSTDNGETFTKIGPVSPKALYRFDQVRNGVVVNGWAGSVYKSEDDGQTWQLWAKMDSTALYATEYMLPTTLVQASEAGYVYTADIDSREMVRNMGKPGGAADDFAYLGYSTLIYATYTGSRSVFISYDEGKTWKDDGLVPTGAPGDWLDHVICMDLEDSVIAIGGTHKGFIVRAAYARSDLYTRTMDPKKLAYPPALTRNLEKGLVGSLYDPRELNEPEDVLLDGHFAYVPCRGSNNLAVIDISDPHHPILASSFRDPELIDAMGVAKHGKYIYITSFSNHLCLVADASDPKKLKKLYSFVVDNAPNLRKVVYSDGYLYLTHDGKSKVYIADARDPARPEIISSIKVGDDGAFAVFPLGNYAYVGGCNPGRSIRIIDISDKRNPKLASSLVDSARYGCICSFRTWGGHYLVAGGWTSRSVSMLDIANPGKPVEAGYLSSDLIDMPNRLTVIGNKAYLINSSNNTLAQVDISNPEKPALDWLVPSWKLKKVYGVASGNGLLYIVGRESMFFLVVNPSKY
jgi:photosystem II stability/assembly factor-like uncharacterized protein